MKALVTIHRANAAGLSLDVVAGGLRVRGPKHVRAALRPELAAAAGEIVLLLGRAPRFPFVNAPQGCAECGGADWTVSVVMDDGSRVCSRCFRTSGRSC